MAHFAQLDANDIVIQVIVVDNRELLSENNEELESNGVAFCQTLFGGATKWKQTSYNGKIRKNYAGIGFYYDVLRDAFIPPKPYGSWVLDENICLWEAPVPYPNSDGNNYVWDEVSLNWAIVNT